jgi:hypothetical protein
MNNLARTHTTCEVYIHREILGCIGDYVVFSNLRPCCKRFLVCLLGHCYDDSVHDITVETFEAERVLQAEITIL